MDPLTLAIIAAAAAKAGTSIWQISKGGMPSPEEEEHKKRMKYRMEYGLFPHERTAVRTTYTPTFARGRDEEQNRLARIFASRGTSYSSDFPGAVAKIPPIGEQLTKVMLPLEMQARSLGEKGYGEILEYLTGRRREAVEEGWEGLGEGIGSGAMALAGGGESPPTTQSDDFGVETLPIGDYDPDVIGGGEYPSFGIRPESAQSNLPYFGGKIGGNVGLPTLGANEIEAAFPGLARLTPEQREELMRFLQEQGSNSFNLPQPSY